MFYRDPNERICPICHSTMLQEEEEFVCPDIECWYSSKFFFPPQTDPSSGGGLNVP